MTIWPVSIQPYRQVQDEEGSDAESLTFSSNLLGSHDTF